MSTAARPELTGRPAIDAQGVPSLPRVLSPDEFDHAQTLSPAGLAQAQFPIVPPPFTPRGGGVPQLAPREATRTGAPDANPQAHQLTGLPRILTQYGFAPLAEGLDYSPVSTALSFTPPGALYQTSMMAKDIAEYAAQKAAEHSLSPEDRARAEADPTRIPGERAAVEAIMLGAAPLIHEGVKAVKGARTPAAAAAKTGAGAVSGTPGAAPTAAPSPALLKVQGHMAAVQDAWRSIFSPPARSPQAGEAANIIRATTGHMAANYEQAAFKLDEFRRAIDPLPDADKLAFIDAIETGQTQPNPEFQGPANEIRKTLDETRDAIIALGTGKLEHFIENYFPHIWADPERAADAFKATRESPAPTGAGAPAAPAAAPLYRETNIDGALAMLGGVAEDMTPKEVFFATHPDLALGQGTNRGVLFEVDPTGLRLQPHAGKPGADFAAAHGAGQEMVARLNKQSAYTDAVRSVTIKPDAVASLRGYARRFDGLVSSLEQQGWTKETLGDGSVKLTRPAESPTVSAGPEALAGARARTMGKRPMEGSKSFLKQRTLPTTADGIAAGLTPVTTNPVDLTLLKLREMQRYLMAHQSLNEMKDAGLVQYVRAGGQAPDGYARINDKIATVFGKPTVEVIEAYDKQQRAALQGAIDRLGGVDYQRKVNLGKKKGVMAGTLGYAQGDKTIVARFGTHDGVVMHELGHILDARYGLQGELAKVPGVPAELKALADLRTESNPNPEPGYRGYIQKPEEQVANALHAYIHAPERGAQVAPKTMAWLDQFLASKPELTGIRDIKPSVEIGAAKEELSLGGLLVRGEHWAPEPVARVVNNYLSPGLRGNAIYDAYRGLGNTLNQAQLGLSAFHLGFTSMDATISRTALGLEYLASGEGLEGLKKVASAPGAPVTNALLGRKIRAAYLNPETASPEMQALANAVQEAGGRVRMDSFYQNSAPQRMIEAWKAGEYGKAVGLSIPALLETAAKPIMEHIVPMQKLGIFGDMSKKILAELPPTATLAERRAALAKAWDSVDNRMGQVVYDNLFWDKTFKDLAMGSVRSVGWNLGTLRELGGGLGDVARAGADVAHGQAPELTHRMAYIAALPITVGVYGALYQYLRTGQGPQELKDYFYPKTGEVDADGNAQRVQLPSYMKDVVAYAGHPWDTIKHKMAPILSSLYEMLENEDFYGDQIRNPMDPLVQQLRQEANYVGEQVVPFSIRNVSEQHARGDESRTTAIGAAFGVTPAPRREVRSDAQNLMTDYLAENQQSGATPEDAAARQSRAEILSGLRGNQGVDLQEAVTDAIERHQLTPKAIVALLKKAGTTPAQEKFKRLTVAQAVNVFKKSTPREQALFAEALLGKIERLQQSDDGAVTLGGP